MVPGSGYGSDLGYGSGVALLTWPRESMPRLGEVLLAALRLGGTKAVLVLCTSAALVSSGRGS